LVSISLSVPVPVSLESLCVAVGSSSPCMSVFLFFTSESLLLQRGLVGIHCEAAARRRIGSAVGWSSLRHRGRRRSASGHDVWLRGVLPLHSSHQRARVAVVAPHCGVSALPSSSSCSPSSSFTSCSSSSPSPSFTCSTSLRGVPLSLFLSLHLTCCAPPALRLQH
jgi:hypothetical protein